MSCGIFYVEITGAFDPGCCFDDHITFDCPVCDEQSDTFMQPGVIEERCHCGVTLRITEFTFDAWYDHYYRKS